MITYMTRLLKQIIYGGSFVTIILIVLLSTYLLAFRADPSCFDGEMNGSEEGVDCGGGCRLTCVLKDLEPVRISSVSLFENNDGSVTVFTILRNFNTDHALPRFNYELNFYDVSGELVDTIFDESFIYAGEIKYLVRPAVRFDAQGIVRADMTITDVTPFEWRTRDEFPLPETDIRDLTFETNDETGELYVAGLLVNESASELNRVSVNGVVFNSLDFPSGVSKTLLQDIQPFEERFFRVVVPGIDPTNIDIDATKIYVEVEL
jgi:hypothetical protein